MKEQPRTVTTTKEETEAFKRHFDAELETILRSVRAVAKDDYDPLKMWLACSRSLADQLRDRSDIAALVGVAASAVMRLAAKDENIQQP